MIKDVVADESKVGSQTATDDTSAQTDDLDSVLSEIDKEFETAKKTKEEAPVYNDELDAKVNFLVKKETDQSISDAVKQVKSGLNDLDVSVSDKVVKSMLSNMASEDKRILDAFNGRYENPGRWEKVLKSATKEIAKEFSIDQNLTKDRESVANAIRGSKTVNTEGDYSFDKFQKNASDSQIEEWKITGKVPDSYKG